MHSTAANRTKKTFWSFLALALAPLAALCLPAVAQSTKQITPTSAPSTSQSASGLSSLPASAQGPISAALGKHDSSYWVHPGAQGLRGENSRHALTADFTKQGPEIRSRNLRWSLETRAYGYGNALHSAKPVAPQANANGLSTAETA